MLNDEKEAKVMQLQLLDENKYWLRHSVFLNMDVGSKWAKVYMEKVCGRYPNLLCTIKKVKYV